MRFFGLEKDPVAVNCHIVDKMNGVVKVSPLFFLIRLYLEDWILWLYIIGKISLKMMRLKVTSLS